MFGCRIFDALSDRISIERTLSWCATVADAATGNDMTDERRQCTTTYTERLRNFNQSDVYRATTRCHFVRAVRLGG